MSSWSLVGRGRRFSNEETFGAHSRWGRERPHTPDRRMPAQLRVARVVRQARTRRSGADSARRLPTTHPRTSNGRIGNMVLGALLDVDGTLIDNNLLHVLAWRRAFQRIGRQIDATTILRGVGMGGDHLVPAILGEVDEATQKAARDGHAEEYVKKGL